MGLLNNTLRFSKLKHEIIYNFFLLFESQEKENAFIKFKHAKEPPHTLRIHIVSINSTIFYLFCDEFNILTALLWLPAIFNSTSLSYRLVAGISMLIACILIISISFYNIKMLQLLSLTGIDGVFVALTFFPLFHRDREIVCAMCILFIELVALAVPAVTLYLLQPPTNTV